MAEREDLDRLVAEEIQRRIERGGRVSSRRRGWADEAIRRAIRGTFGRGARWEDRAAFHHPDGVSVYWGAVGGHRVTVEVSP